MQRQASYLYLTNFQWKLFRFITSFNLYCHLLAIALQKYGFQRAKRGFLHCKKWVFTLQKGGFYTPKTPLLFFVSITNTLLMCYEYSVNWLRTFRQAQGTDSSCLYPCVTKTVYSRHQIRVFTLLNTHFHITHAHICLPFRGCIHICGHDKSVPYGC